MWQDTTLIVVATRPYNMEDYVQVWIHQQGLTSLPLHQWSLVGGPWAASGPPAAYLWPPNYYSFTMCFGWVGTCIPGRVSVPTIHRQRVAGPLTAASAIFNFHFCFFEQFACWHFDGCGSQDCMKMLCSKFTAKRKVDSGNSKKNGLKNMHSFSLQPAQDPRA